MTHGHPIAALRPQPSLGRKAATPQTDSAAPSPSQTPPKPSDRFDEQGRAITEPAPLLPPSPAEAAERKKESIGVVRARAHAKRRRALRMVTLETSDKQRCAIALHDDGVRVREHDGSEQLHPYTAIGEAARAFVQLVRAKVQSGYEVREKTAPHKDEPTFDELLDSVTDRQLNLTPFEQPQREARLDHADHMLASLGTKIEKHGRVVQEALERSKLVKMGERALDGELGKKIDRAARRAHRIADTVGGFVEERAVDAEIYAAAVKESGKALEGRLRATGARLRDTAEKIERDARGLHGEEAEQAKATSKALDALGSEIQQKAACPKLHAAIAACEAAMLEIAANGVEIVGKLAKWGTDAAGFVLSFSGRILKKLLGRESLENTAIELAGGVRVGLFHSALNAGVFGAVYFPSLEQAREKGSYSKAMYFDDGASAASPVLSVGRNRRGKTGVSINLFFTKASFDEKSETLFAGLPGVFGVVLGRDIERGPFFALGGATPGNPVLSLFATYGFAVYTPLLRWVSENAVRPVARVLAHAGAKVTGWIENAWSAMAGKKPAPPSGASEAGSA